MVGYKSEIKKRQEIGRGLRIAVNQNGERVYGFDVNTLTVMTNESYEDFVFNLQKEIGEAENIEFGRLEKHIFANITKELENGEIEYLGSDASLEIWKSCLEYGYINEHGKIQDKLVKAVSDNNVSIEDKYQSYEDDIIYTLKKITKGLEVKNIVDKSHIKVNRDVLDSPEFKKLWDRIKHKTTYKVDFDSNKLIASCADKICKELRVSKSKFKYHKAKTEISKSSNWDSSDESESTYDLDVHSHSIPDVLSYLQNKTNLKRSSILNIIIGSKRLEDLKNNPQSFIEQAGKIINDEKKRFIIDGIKYEKIGDEYFYSQELFENEELYGYLGKNMREAKKSVYDYVVYDSDIESNFAESFENNEEIKLYAKLPSWFKIDTPLGSYNPDWAVMMEKDGKESLYFVVESKGSIYSDDLRINENAKIKCGKSHFESLGKKANYIV